VKFPRLALGVGVTDGTTVGGATAVGAAVGTSRVGGALCIGTPANTITVPNTILTTTAPFNNVLAHQRQSRFVSFGLILRGILILPMITAQIIPHSRVKTNLRIASGG
jgi:hypothetical protein